MMTRLRKFLRLPSSERRFLLEAVLLLALIRLGLYVLPLRALQRALARAVKASTPSPGTDQSFPRRVGWAVAVASRYVPRATCLAQALAVRLLLEREGYPAHLRVGLARDARRWWEGHAWVEHQGRIIIGGGFVPDILLPAFEEDGSDGG